MKFEVTGRGVYDAKGKPVEPGTVLNLKGDDVPGWLVNKGQVVAESKGKREAVTNPAQGADTVDGADTVAGGQ